MESHRARPQPSQPVDRASQRRDQRRDRARRRRRRPSFRARISARALWDRNAYAKFNLIGGASPCSPLACARSFARGHYFEAQSRRRWSPPASNSRRLRRWLQRGQRGPARQRGRDHHRRPRPARRVPDLPAAVGAQGNQLEKLARTRARRTREDVSAIRSASRSLSLIKKTPTKQPTTPPYAIAAIPK